MSKLHLRLRITLRCVCVVAIAAVGAFASCDRKDEKPSEPAREEPQPAQLVSEPDAAETTGTGGYVVPKVDVFGVPDQMRERLARAYDTAMQTPNDADKIGALGMAYLACDSSVAAAACFTRATELAPDAFHWWHYLALSAERMYDKDLAIEAYENAIAREVGYVPAFIRLADMLVESEPGRAEPLYARVVELSKDMPLAHFGLARCAELQGRSEDAISHYRKAVELAPDFSEAHGALVTLLTDSGKSVEAQKHIIARDGGGPKPALMDPLVLRLFAESRKPESDDADPAEEAERLIAAGRIDQAVDLLQSRLETHPGDTAARNALAIALGGQGNVEEAAEHFTLLIKAEPDNLFVRANLGKLYMRARHYRKASGVFDELLSRDADDITARQLRAMSLVLSGHAAEALPELQALAEQSSGIAGDSFNLALTLVSTGQFEDAIAQYRKFVGNLPETQQNANPIRVFTNELVKIIVDQEKLATDKSAVYLEPKHMILLADALLAAGMKPESEIVRTYPQVLAADAFSLAQAGRLDDALGFLDMIASADMGGVLLSTRGAILGMAGKPEEAADAFRQALEVNPDLLAAKAGLGQALAALGKPEEAERLLREVIEKAPSDLHAVQTLAIVVARKGDLEQAVAIARPVVEAQPENAGFRVLLGELLIGLNKNEDAIEHLRKAVAIQPADVRARYLLGMTLQRTGDSAGAKQQWQAAIDTAPAFIDPVIALTGLEASEKNHAAALKVLDKGLEHAPESPLLINAKAWVLATCADAKLRDGVQAMRLAEKACQLTDQKAPEFLDTLAAAYAEAGRFEDAADTERQAILVATEAKQLEVAESFKPRLELYEAGKPYREE
ncbi:MAG: tetratricopeptide repeat protein [Planctomycetota bacterium]